jgi:CubicO group peptidase (beta-lactamase class C family)
VFYSKILLIILSISLLKPQSVDLSAEWNINDDFSLSNELEESISDQIATLPNTLGFIVIHQGEIVSENYYNSNNENEINIWSVTKSFISTLVGQAVDMNLIEDPDSSISFFFPEYDIDYLREISLHDLLSMTTGYFDAYGYPQRMNESTENLLSMGHSSPGSFFYNNSACHINSHIIFKKTEMTPLEFGNNYLFPHLGIENPNWHAGYQNINDGSASLYLNLRDMVKLGQLYLQNGLSGSEQIISSDWVERATNVQTGTGWGYYGYLWWLPDDLGTSYSAQGFGGQVIAVYPEYDLVIGAQSDIFGSGDNNSHSNLLNDRINIIASIFEDYENPDDMPTVTGFELSTENHHVILNWENVNVDGFSYYILERSTSDNFNTDVVSNYLSNNFFEDNQLEYNIEYFYRVAYFADELSEYSDTLSIVLQQLDNDNYVQSPSSFKLYSNYPNPFNPVTSLSYDLPKDSYVSIIIYDMLGNVINNLVKSNQSSGFKSVQWNATNNQGEPVSAGVYFYSIQAGEFRQTKKMILLK